MALVSQTKDFLVLAAVIFFSDPVPPHPSFFFSLNFLILLGDSFVVFVRGYLGPFNILPTLHVILFYFFSPLPPSPRFISTERWNPEKFPNRCFLPTLVNNEFSALFFFSLFLPILVSHLRLTALPGIQLPCFFLFSPRAFRQGPQERFSCPPPHSWSISSIYAQ